MGALYHQRESCRRFCLFDPRGDRERRERSAEDGRLGPENAWQPLGALSLFLGCISELRREKTEHTHTHTHTRTYVHTHICIHVVQDLFKGIKGLRAMHETETELPS